MFTDDGLWAVLCLSEEVEKIKIILVDHQILTTYKHMIETVQARLQDLTNVAAESYEISVWQKWQTESWKQLSLLEPPVASLLR